MVTDAIRKAMKDSGRTMYRVAQDCGLNYAMVHRFFTSRRTISLPTADRLAEYFELEIRTKAAPPAAKHRKRGRK